VARRVLALILLGLALVVCVVLAASESLTNRTGRTATAVTVTFSEQVRITSYDEAVFPQKEPSSRASTFKFSGGQLENGARFSVSWTPSGATIESYEWATEPDLNGPLPVGEVWDQRRVDRINRLLAELSQIVVTWYRDYYSASEHEGGFTTEDVLAALSDLAILTLGVENYTTSVKDPVTGVEETIIGGEYGRHVSRTLLEYRQPGWSVLRVYNVGNINPEGGAGNEIYSYELVLPGRRFLTVNVFSRYARAGSGCDLGVCYMKNLKYTDTESTPKKLRIYELFFENPDPKFLPNLDPTSLVSTFIVSNVLDDNGQFTVVELEGWIFAEGNPDAILYRPPGPP
jgi:hypothetical protein